MTREGWIMSNRDLNLNTTLKTEVRYKSSPEMIELQTWQNDFLSDRMRQISANYIDLQNKAVREALLDLGWFPPSIGENEREDYLRHELKRVGGERDEYFIQYNEMKEELGDFKAKLKEFVKEEE
jgi:hypothetical protein